MTSPAQPPQLKRVLTLRDLVFYGIILITPIAPVPIYGVAQQLSRGHVFLCLLLAGVAMMLTAVSYGRMAAIYPSAGSAYVYVGRGLNSHLGFLAGWALTLDYVVLPIVAIIQASLAVARLVPSVPYAVWASVFSLGIMLLNLRGIRATAGANTILLSGMSVIIAAFLILSGRYLFLHGGVNGFFSLAPIYNPGTFDAHAIATATSFAALTYIGFDGVTTLAEDAKDPKRNILLAILLVCAFTTLFSCLLVYLAQIVWPNYETFPNVEMAFLDVAHRVGGHTLFAGMGLVVFLSSLGGGMAAVVAAARVLLGMGRDNVLPNRIFAYLNPKNSTPTFNIVLVSIIGWIGSLLLNLEHAGELLNFGAFLSFMGVNLAAARQCYFVQEKSKRRLVLDALVPLVGFLFCLAIWLSLPIIAKLVGGIWFAIGMVYYATRSRAILLN